MSIMNRTFVVTALVPLALLAGPLAAQEPREPVTIGTTAAIESEILGEERRVLVYLPDEYDEDASAYYPVLYLLDGDFHFHHVTGVVDFLSAHFHIPPMIVVGIANTDRNRDLTPPAENTTVAFPDPFSGDTIFHPFPTGGGADDFLRFLVEELAPRIEGEYRAAPFRMLAGHSLGGLFTLHAFTTRPQSFDAYLAISPSLQWDDRSLIRRTRTGLDALPLDGRFLYMAVGDQEFGDMMSNLRAFADALDHADPEGLRWWYRVMPDETHPSVVHRTVYDGLGAIFGDFRVSQADLGSWDVAQLEAHFADASTTYG